MITELFIDSLKQQDIEQLQAFTKIIAIAVRNELEDFHVEHLTNTQMKELNPLVRKGIFSVLFSLSTAHTSEAACEYLKFQMKCIPNYWEDANLDDSLKKSMEKLNEPSPLILESEFLKQQLEIGNIEVDHFLKGIQIIASYDLKGDGNVQNLKSKIRRELKKEGFVYNYSKDRYIRFDRMV